MLSKYVPKTFGKYTFNVCEKTKYFDALGMLSVYNETHESNKLLKKMNQHINHKKFQMQIVADFDKISLDKKIDYDYLNNLCENNDGPKKWTIQN